MAAEVAIRAEAVSKRYRIYRRRHQSLKEVLVRRSLGDWDDLWALRDVTFDVPRGQALGVIGHNGSGKSTLLKLLSRILYADAGRLDVEGRVSSLLELGAGFQPEYTGSENVYLYGALLGLKRREIEAKYDSIVEFSELGDFIDYPVKNYSSGMYMRLGFAVAVHLDPDVLLIDEVLAVGDAAFQQKCFEHLRALRSRRCTIVLVSHDLDSVSRFCDRAIWLDHGRLLADGPPDSTIERYLESAAKQASQSRRQRDLTGQAQPSHEVALTSVRLIAGGRESRTISSGETLAIELEYEATSDFPSVDYNVTVFRNDGVRCLDAPLRGDQHTLAISKGTGRATVEFPSFSLHAGLYDLTIAIYDRASGQMLAYHDRLYPFTVKDARSGQGVVWLSYRWRIGDGAAVDVEAAPAAAGPRRRR